MTNTRPKSLWYTVRVQGRILQFGLCEEDILRLASCPFFDQTVGGEWQILRLTRQLATALNLAISIR